MTPLPKGLETIAAKDLDCRRFRVWFDGALWDAKKVGPRTVNGIHGIVYRLQTGEHDEYLEVTLRPEMSLLVVPR